VYWQRAEGLEDWTCVKSNNADSDIEVPLGESYVLNLQ